MQGEFRLKRPKGMQQVASRCPATGECNGSKRNRALCDLAMARLKPAWLSDSKMQAISNQLEKKRKPISINQEKRQSAHIKAQSETQQISGQLEAIGENQIQHPLLPNFPAFGEFLLKRPKGTKSRRSVFWPGNRLPKFGRRVARLARRLSEATWARSACEGNAARRDESADEW